MTDQHPITPPQDRVYWWWEEACKRPPSSFYEKLDYVAEQAAQWGADQELDACCEWVQGYAECGDSLRAARRSKPKSLAEEALKILNRGHEGWGLADCDWHTIRHALERLQELEGQGDG